MICHTSHHSVKAETVFSWEHHLEANTSLIIWGLFTLKSGKKNRWLPTIAK